jgi:myo-inositol-1(or 4)-monophosphatase
MVTETQEREYLARIQRSLELANKVVRDLVGQDMDRPRRDMVRDAELQISQTLRDALQRSGEGWLCEEHADDEVRLGCDVAWVVDPVDGTIEFISGLPEWSISVGLVIHGEAVAGGIYNPETEELFLGSRSLGTTYNGKPVPPAAAGMDGGVVLASRQECGRGEWERFQGKNFSVRAVGSVAYKLALVSAGLAAATWTLCPKHEWDVAAGVALIHSSGGRVSLPGKVEPRFNQPDTLLPGLIASGAGVWDEVNRIVEPALSFSPSGSSRNP